MSKIVNFRELEVWQRAIELTDLVYDITAKFPDEERYGLSAQMRKAAVSIPSNIAEGTRHRLPGYISRVMISLGEHAELLRSLEVSRGHLGVGGIGDSRRV